MGGWVGTLNLGGDLFELGRGKGSEVEEGEEDGEDLGADHLEWVGGWVGGWVGRWRMTRRFE